MNVISKRGLVKKAQKLDDSLLEDLLQWFQAARRADWHSLEDVHAQFPSAELVGRVPIFDVRHNAYRPIVRHELPWSRLFVKAVLTHKEYDRKEWIKWS